MKKTRGDKTKKRQTKNKKIKGGSKSKSITRKNGNEISEIILIAEMYYYKIKQLEFCMYDAFDKIENAKLTKEKHNFYKAFINYAVNNVFKPLYEISMIDEKDITRMIEKMRMYINNNKYVGGAKLHNKPKRISDIIIIMISIFIAAFCLTSMHNFFSNTIANQIAPTQGLPVSNAIESTQDLNVSKEQYMQEMFKGTNELMAEIKQNSKLMNYLTNKYGSCLIISFFYDLTLSNMSERRKEKIIEEIKKYFRGLFVPNSPKHAFLPNRFNEIIYGNKNLHGENLHGENLGIMGDENNSIKNMLRLKKIPPSENSLEYINNNLKESIDKSEINVKGNLSLRIVTTPVHAFVLLSYCHIDVNNEVKIANCVLDSNMINPNFPIDNFLQLEVLCDKNFPFPHKLLKEANVVVTEEEEDIFRNQKYPITYIQTLNDENNLNPQINIKKSFEYIEEVIIHGILSGFEMQIKLFKIFEDAEQKQELKVLFGGTKEDLIVFYRNLEKLYGLNNFENSEEEKMNPRESNLNENTKRLIQALHREGNLPKLPSYSRKK
jgi:hypothetical protein